MEIILTAKNLSKQFGEQTVLRKIHLEIEAGCFTAILGPSGSGKSTLLSVLSGLTRPTEGSVFHRGTDISSLTESGLANWKRNHVGHVFQNYLLLQNLTVEENIQIGIAPEKEHLSFDRIVRLLDIQPLLHKFPSQLSGGEQQRVGIARAVIKRPALLFCDEATGALDETNSKRVVELLHMLQSTFGITILFTTHNQQIARTADRILTMKDGQIHGDKINENPISACDMAWG